MVCCAQGDSNDGSLGCACCSRGSTHNYGDELHLSLHPLYKVPPVTLFPVPIDCPSRLCTAANMMSQTLYQCSSHMPPCPSTTHACSSLLWVAAKCIRLSNWIPSILYRDVGPCHSVPRCIELGRSSYKPGSNTTSNRQVTSCGAVFACGSNADADASTRGRLGLYGVEVVPDCMMRSSAGAVCCGDGASFLRHLPNSPRISSPTPQ